MKTFLYFLFCLGFVSLSQMRASEVSIPVLVSSDPVPLSLYEGEIGKPVPGACTSSIPQWSLSSEAFDSFIRVYPQKIVSVTSTGQAFVHGFFASEGESVLVVFPRSRVSPAEEILKVIFEDGSYFFFKAVLTR